MLLTELTPKLELTLLKADVTRAELEKLCADARAQNCYGICINSSLISRAAHLLEDTDLKITSTIGFPLGVADADVKRYETEVAIDNGAHEIEVVLNPGLLKDGANEAVLRELRDVVEAADERPVKVLLETSLLSRDQIVLATKLAVEAEAKFVTLSAVFGTRELSPELLTATREAVGPKFGIKVFAHANMLADAARLLETGATRLGISIVPRP